MGDEKLFTRAKFYLNAMSKGINPTTGEFVPETDALADKRIQRCMEYVLNLIENPKVSVTYRSPLSLSPEQKDDITISDESVGVNEVAKRINAVLNADMRKTSGVAIASWLVKEGYLSITEGNDGRSRKTLGARASELDMTEVYSEYNGIKYLQVRYGPAAQRFIVNNIEKIYD